MQREMEGAASRASVFCGYLRLLLVGASQFQFCFVIMGALLCFVYFY